ncbi:MAG: uroporphyrinogen decarboxylase family protein [Candidatus Hodarchaeota archaeon]
MNAHDRVLTALDGDQPDRVPLFELAIDNSQQNLRTIYNFISGIQKLMQNKFNNTLIRFLGRLAGRKTINGIIKKIGMKGGKFATLTLVKAARQFGIDATTLMIGILFASNFKLSSRFDYYIDEYGRMGAINKDTLTWYKGGIMTPELLDEWGFPKPLEPSRLALYHEGLELNKDNKILLMAMPGGMFQPVVEGVGYEKFSFYIYDKPSFIRKLFSLQTKYLIELSKYCIENGTECIAFADDSCYKSGPMISPKLFEKWIFPGYRKICNAIHKRGGKTLLHSDGDTHMIIDGWIKAGIDAIHPFEPPMMNLREAKEKWGDKVCICGNVDCGIALVYGPKQRIIDEVKRCINEAAEGGGYMLSSSNTIHYGVPIKNYEIMIEAARKYGVYR